MIYFTGDTHAEFTRLSKYLFKAGKGDLLIVCGDFGGVWDASKQEKYWLDWLSQKEYTVAFCDGNHENFDLLDTYPIELWNGGKVHKIRDNVIHLMRGQVFDIEGKKFFVFGGARSHDISDGILDKTDPNFKFTKSNLDKKHKLYRINHVSWWEEEMPSQEEMDEGLANLDRADFKVDAIVSHCAPSSIQKMINPTFYTDKLTSYLEQIKNTCTFRRWFFGHYHIDRQITDEFSALFYGIVPYLENATVVE